MAKKQKAENAEAKEGQTTETAAPAKEPKPEKVYFLGPKWCAPNSVFGNIKAIIAANQNIGEGKGVATSFIVSEMLSKYAPKKSANYGEKYVRAYARDLEKFGYATTNVAEAVAELTSPPEKAKKETKKAVKVSEAGQKILDKMAELISENEYKNGESTVTSETLATALGMKPMAVGKAVEALVKNEFVGLKEVGETIQILFTQKGWDQSHQQKAA